MNKYRVVVNNEPLPASFRSMRYQATVERLVVPTVIDSYWAYEACGFGSTPKKAVASAKRAFADNLLERLFPPETTVVGEGELNC